MANDKLLRALEDLGLSDGEARVYLAALTLGSASVVALARSAGLKRTTVYSIIDSLRSKGLIVPEMKGLRKVFAPEHPEKLGAMIEARRLSFQNLLPEFSAIYSLPTGESSIRFYQGLEETKEVYEGLLRDIRPGDDYMILSVMGKWYALDPDFFQSFTERRAALSRKLGFRIRLMVQDAPIARAHKKIQRELNETIKILPKSTSLTTNLVIIPKKVVIHQVVPPISALVIDNPHVVRMHQEMFELMWNSLPDAR